MKHWWGGGGVTFDASLFNPNGTISLSGSALSITADTTITGPGAEQLTIDAHGASTVMGVAAGVTATISGLTLTGGVSVAPAVDGGAIFNWGDLTLTDMAVVGNSATNVGGGIASRAPNGSTASLTIVRSTIDNNSAPRGAGINVDASGTGTHTLTIDSSAISNNKYEVAVGGGSGLLLSSPGTATIRNSTLSGNKGNLSGAIRISDVAATLDIENSTIAFNSSNTGGAISRASAASSIVMNNSIVAENTSWAGADSDFGNGVSTSSTHNLIGRGGGSGLTNGVKGNIVLTSTQTAGLGPLADNGGPTRTHALLTGSKAINAGSDTATIGVGLLADQRGLDRFIGPADIGAYEVGLPSSPPSSSTWDTLMKDDNSGFGIGWDLSNVDRLLFDVDPLQPDMIRLVRADGFLIDFADFDETSGADASASIISDADPTYYVRRDKFGNTWYYSRSAANKGALVKSTDRLGVGREYVYGDHDGDFKSFEIESVTVIRPGQLGETTTYGYDGARIDEVTDPFSRTTNLSYNGNGFLDEIMLPAPDPLQPTVRPTFSFTYDGTGFLASITDADSRTTEYDLAGSGELTITYADDGERRVLPALGDVFNQWRAQLGAWAAALPEFKAKVVLDGLATTGYEVDQLGRISTYELDAHGQVVEMTDAAGSVTQTERNSAGLATEITVLASGSGAIVNRTEYTYDAQFNLIRIDYYDTTHETWDYDDDFSQLVEHVDPLGRQTLYDVDPVNGNLLETRVVVGLDDRASSEHDDVVTQYDYEADGLVSQIVELRNDVDGTPQLSRVTQYAYTDVDDSGPTHVGRWLDETEYGGDDPTSGGVSLVNGSAVTVLARNEFGQPTLVSDEVARETAYEYDDLDRLISVISPNPGGGQYEPVTEYAYALSGLLTDATLTRVGGGSGDRITTHYAYDDVGRLEHVYEDYGGAKEAETQYVYDLAGNVVERIDALGHSTHVQYNVLNLPIAVTEEDPDGTGPLASPVTLMAYDAQQRRIALRDAEGNLTRWRYDLLGRVTQEIQPLGILYEWFYNLAGQVTATADPEGRLTNYTYDDAGRLATADAPGFAAAIQYEYDSLGNLRIVTDSLGHDSERVYDERGRVVEAIDANEDATLFSYTNANELETLTDAAGNETTWAYDGAGRVASETNELNDARTYRYDAYGRLTEKTDRNGRVTTYEYDSLHQLTAEKWYVGVNLQRTISYDFDKVGNLLSVSDPAATYEYEYDNLNRVTVETQSIAGLTPTIEFDKSYDGLGRIITSAAQIGSSADYLNSYAYDAAGRLTSLTQAGNGGNAVSPKRVDFGYNLASQLTTVDRYASTTTASPVATTVNSYNVGTGLLEAIAHEAVAPGSTFAETLGYGYDGANRIDAFSSVLEGWDAILGYDERGQLTDVADSGVGNYDATYDYDGNGNRTGTSGGLPNDGAYSVGDNNRLAFDGTYTYAYDDEGNRTARFIDDDSDGQLSDGDDDVTLYSWDHRNRLISVVNHPSQGGMGGFIVTQSVVFAYDPVDQLVKQTSDPDGFDEGESEKSYFIQENGQVVLQFDKTGEGDVAESDLSHRYLWGATVDQLLADEQVESLTNVSLNDTLWTLADHLGSVREAVDSAGNLRLRRTFDAFGNVVNEGHYDAAGLAVAAGQAGYVDEAFAFTGRYRDELTGLQNNLNRWYDPRVGRWLSEDPIGFAGGDANLYRYVGNQATMIVDPTGLLLYPGWYIAHGIPYPSPSPHPAPPPKSLYWYYFNDNGVSKPLLIGSAAVGGVAGGLWLAGINPVLWEGGILGWATGGTTVAEEGLNPLNDPESVFYGDFTLRPPGWGQGMNLDIPPGHPGVDYPPFFDLGPFN